MKTKGQTDRETAVREASEARRASVANYIYLYTADDRMPEHQEQALYDIYDAGVRQTRFEIAADLEKIRNEARNDAEEYRKALTTYIKGLKAEGK